MKSNNDNHNDNNDATNNSMLPLSAVALRDDLGTKQTKPDPTTPV